ncbi:hypothetical protein ACFE04_005059 [Oxalis oulophora]
MMIISIKANEKRYRSCLFVEDEFEFVCDRVLSLSLISIGQGAFNPSLQALGTDQWELSELDLSCTTVDGNEQNSNIKKTVFFQWWYFGLCTGSLLGVTLMSYIQDNFGWVIGFAIPTVGMIATTICFSCGSRFFAKRIGIVVGDKPPLQDIVRSIKSAASTLFLSKVITLSNENHEMELELQEKPLCAGKNSCDDENNQNQFLENTKVILRLLPLWTMMLMFAVNFQQPSTFFTKQGTAMQRNIGSSSFKIPPATLQSVITLSIMSLMPFYDKIFIPMTRIITRNKKGISVMQRMGIGMVMSVFAMVIAAIVETKRREIGRNMTKPDDVALSIYWLLPQYILLGISDIFSVVGMQEFFYSEVPPRMRTMGFALYTSVFGVGSFMSSLVITLIEACLRGKHSRSWFVDDMNEARLDKYYWLLAIASLLSFLLYLVLCKCYRSRSELENESCK